MSTHCPLELQAFWPLLWGILFAGPLCQRQCISVMEIMHPSLPKDEGNCPFAPVFLSIPVPKALRLFGRWWPAAQFSQRWAVLTRCNCQRAPVRGNLSQLAWHNPAISTICQGLVTSPEAKKKWASWTRKWRNLSCELCNPPVCLRLCCRYLKTKQKTNKKRSF